MLAILQRLKWPCLFLVLCSIICCRPNRQIYAAHNRRVDEINERYDQAIEETKADWAELVSHVEARRELLIPVRKGKNYAPVRPVHAGLADRWQACAEVLRREPHPCESDLTSAYAAALRRVYFAADFGWVAAQMQGNTARPDVEALLAFSHNTTLLAWISSRLAELAEKQREAVEQWERLRELELDASLRQQNRDIAAHDRRTRQAIAAGLQAFGNSLQQSTAENSASLTSDRACSSDYSCPAGEVCVKPNYSARGVCLKSVDRHGTPQYQVPRTESVGPKLPHATDCKNAMDCPVGFRCDVSSGACLQ